MKSSNLNLYRLRTSPSIGFSWYLIVFLVALLMTVTRSVGHEIHNSEGQESESVLFEQNHGKFQLQQGLSYHYEPQNRREPFLPLVFPKHRGLSSSSSIEQSRTHEPTWKLLGIISGMHGFYASIQNSEGKRYIVTAGSVIPSERLKVKRISETELEFDYLDERTGSNNLERSQKLIVSF